MAPPLDDTSTDQETGRPHGICYVVRGRPGLADRPSLPAGHPVTWGAITEGTVLESAEYPFPVFLH